ncbi:hypothetical protein NQ318_009921 [Aromia moschata]|uniref:Transposase n=1 Tax=Aromia moschata TaxID=1265417 RepID=A0AAV8YA94_9CUCU|nr:hypothetical protein NQ318_009921 [Aromia moschata]
MKTFSSAQFRTESTYYGKICRNIRAQWSAEDLSNAIKAVDRGLSQQKAATRFGIRRRTIRNHIKTGKIERKLGRQSILSPQQEKDLTARILRLADVGYPVTPQIMRHQKLGEVLDTLDFKNKPERIYNMDEKGCRLTIHHQQSVLALKGTKRLHLVAPEHAENVTVVEYPAFEDNLPDGTLVKMAPKGSMTTELFVQFIQHLSKFKIVGPILLVFDGAASHLDYTIVEEADKHNITLLCLPSNTTHELQPLDKSVYRSFEAHWDQEVFMFWESHPDRRITKSRFNLIFTKVWSRCMTNENIINGFRTTQYDESAIPLSAFAPSEPTECFESQLEPNRIELIDSESSSEDELPLATVKTPFK